MSEIETAAANGDEDIALLLIQWQNDQHEFFNPNTLEIVAEYAAWREAHSKGNRWDDIIEAYQRGAQWTIENPGSPEYASKASWDYADKITSTPTTNKDGEVE